MAITSKGEKVVAFSGGGPIGPDRMELLEQKVNVLSEDVAVIIRSNYATKADLHAAEVGIQRWLFGAIVAIVGILGTVIWRLVSLLAGHR